MISRQQAHAQGAALSAAAKHSPVGPLRDQLRAMSNEWSCAVADYDSIMGEPGDELAPTRDALIQYVTALVEEDERVALPAMDTDGTQSIAANEAGIGAIVDLLRPDLSVDPGDGAAIVLVGICGPGMYAIAGGANDETDWLRVIRVMHNGGQSSLHLEGAGGRDVYRNFMGPMSPTVVRA